MYNKCFEAYDKTIINFISLKNENKNSGDDSNDSEDLQEPPDSDDDVTVEGYYFLRITKNHVCSNYPDDSLGMCDPLNLMIYKKLILRIILRLVLLKINITLKFAQLIMMPMKILKLELKLYMVDKIMNLLYKELVYFVKLHPYWLENVMNFMGPSQKNNLSIFSVPQLKALYFHYFILKVPFFLHFFVNNFITSFIRFV